MIVSLTRRLATAGVAFLLLAEGQTATTDKVARLGLLLYTSSLNQVPKLAAAFRDGPREHGLVEGRNLVIEERWAEGRTERLAKLATELVRLRVDVKDPDAPLRCLRTEKSLTDRCGQRSRKR